MLQQGSPVRRFRLAIHAATAACMALASASISAAPLPIADLAYGGNGDGIARIAAAIVPADDGYATHAAVQADGRLVLAGAAEHHVDQQTESRLVLARLDVYGHPDDGFGADHDGLFRSAFPGYADDVAQTGDGTLIYVGHDANFQSMIVGRLHTDGTPDTGFFLNGRRLIAPSALLDSATQGYFATVLPLPGGKLLALGMAVVPTTPAQYFTCAIRISADGSTDTDFGTAGRTCIAPVLPSGAASQALGGAVLADGRILLAGASQHSGGSGWDMSVARLGTDGTLDTGFGPAHDGWAFVGFDQGGTMIDLAAAIAVDGDGRILLAGYLEGVHGPDFGVARLLPDGGLDASFGTQGRVQIALDLGSFDDDRAHSIAVLPGGSILIGGWADTDADAVGVAVLLKPDGTLDPHFGSGGVFLQADPNGPQTTRVASQQQMLAGDHLYMVGSALNAGNGLDFAATRTTLPLFADGFDD